MSLLDLLPKNPKIDDLVALLGALDTRVTGLDMYVLRNDERIKVLEEFMASHQAGATARQREVNRLTAENQRLRWALAHGRQP